MFKISKHHASNSVVPLTPQSLYICVQTLGAYPEGDEPYHWSLVLVDLNGATVRHEVFPSNPGDGYRMTANYAPRSVFPPDILVTAYFQVSCFEPTCDPNHFIAAMRRTFGQKYGKPSSRLFALFMLYQFEQNRCFRQRTLPATRELEKMIIAESNRVVTRYSSDKYDKYEEGYLAPVILT